MGIRPTVMLPPEPDERWQLARQLGVTHAVTRLPTPPTDADETGDRSQNAAPWEFQPLLHMHQRFGDAGFKLHAIEDIYPPLTRVRSGDTPSQGVEEMRTLVENMGALDIPVLCYSWMACFNWFRTSTSVRTRGGALTTRFDAELVCDAPPAGSVSEATLWERMEFFLERIVPRAERAGVTLALHPDDPPVSPLRGVDRVITTPEAVERALELYPSPANGLTFCQGTFSAMDEDIPAMIHRFADNIQYVHFRDVAGTRSTFTETWHDAGPTDMLGAMQAYDKIGFDGLMRPDHVPTMAGELNDAPGYKPKGRLFAVGYMRGLLEQTHE